MTETFSEQPEELPKINRIVVIDRLNEIGIDVSLKDWIGYSDQQILNDLARLSCVLEIGLEDMFEACAIETTNTGEDDEV